MRPKFPATFKLGELTVVSVGGGEAVRMPMHGDSRETIEEPRQIPSRLEELVQTLVALKKEGKKR